MKSFATTQKKSRILTAMIFLMLTANAFSQETRVISGILKDKDGTVIPGASVYIKGTTKGTVSNANGFYSIEAPVGSTLVYSFIGYGTSEVYVAPTDTEKNKKGKSMETNLIPKDTITLKPPKVFKHTIPDGSGKTLSPYFFVQSDNPEVDKMPLKATSADVSISGVIADVKVKQVYVNEGRNVLEAIYIFPGSTKAAVYGMTMKVGQRLLKAKIKEKQQARTEYETAKKEGKTASLLEQNRPNIFQMNVANILPGDTIVVELTYTELIESIEGVYEFVYPTVVGPRYSETPDTKENQNESWVQNPYLQEGKNPPYTFDLKMNINTGIPIQKIYSPSHETNIAFTEKDKATLTLSNKEKLGGNRDFILRYGLRGGKVESGILLHENGDENFFLMMMEPPEAPSEDDIPPREYIFIMDVSGSMHGFPLEISKSVMQKLFHNLKETDKFNILTFAGGNSMMWKESRPATTENIAESADFVNRQSGGGGTRLLDALERALKIDHDEGYSRTFVVMTDGYVDVEKESFSLVRKNLGEANLFALGIGSSTNRYLIEGLAHAGMGESYIATTYEEGEKVGKKLVDYIERPVLTGISIDFNDFKAYDYEPSSIPDVFAKRPILVYGKYSGNSEGDIKIKGYSGSTPYVKTFHLKDASKSNNQALRYLWARNKVRYIDDYSHYYTCPNQYNAKPDKTQDQITEITNLGLKYNILTQYTSFIAIDSLIRNKTNEITTVNQPLPLPKGVSNLAIGNQPVSVSSATGPDISVSLTPDVCSLQEVVVVGYGTVKKTDLTGSVSSVSSSGISDASSVQQALQGKLSGVQIISNSGNPGSGTTVRVRGGGSLMGNSQPLYVVDGIPVAANEDPSVNPLLNIDVASIESMEVLKDASSTAIYGSRGASGVILINTKKGMAKPSVTLAISTGISTISSSIGSIDQGYWYQNLKRNGAVQQIHLGLRGRYRKFQYNSSLGFMNEKGVIDGSGVKKHTGNIDVKWTLFKDRVDAGFSGITGYSVLNDYLMLYDPQAISSSVPVKRDFYNVNAKAFVNIHLPIKGLVFRNEVVGSVSNKQTLLNEMQTPISFQTMMNDNVQLNNSGFNSGFSYDFTKGNSSFSANAFYERSAIVNRYNHHNGTAGYENYHVKDLTQEFAINSLLARVNYSFADRYLFTTTIRRDVSQRFTTGKKGIALPSLAVGWNINKEGFFLADFISNLKVRYNIGLTANCQFPFYPLTSLISAMGGITVPSIAENKELEWEKTNKQNLGADIGLFNSRLNLSIDFFRNKTFSMYYLSRLDELNNYYEWINAGNYVNKGMDFSTDAVLVNRNNIRINGRINLAMNRTRITEITANRPGVELETVNGIVAGQSLKVGDPLGVYYGYKVQSIDNNLHRIEFEDVNKDGTIGNEDLRKIADTNPRFYGGAGLDISVKNFECAAQLNFVSGNQVINSSKDLSRYGNYTSNKSAGNHVITGLYVEDGSYLRLSEFSVGYNLPRYLLTKWKIDKIRFRLIANNLLTFTRYSGQDPEFNNYCNNEREIAKVLPGIDRNFYPVSRSIHIKLEIDF